MPLSGRFSKIQLQSIIEEATIYMCACPAQVCQQLLSLVALYEYQEQCGERQGNQAVHDSIAASTAIAYAELENCLDRILEIEGWDRATLKMPPGLRKLQRLTMDQP